MKKIIAAVTFAFVLAGCATPRTAYLISAPFDTAQAERQMLEGENTIQGNAFMRQAGGGVVSCAGSSVYLIPSTAYAAERMLSIYGNTVSGSSTKQTSFEPDLSAYKTLSKTATCDSQGNFAFDKVADGEFFLATNVAWMIGPYNRQGGSMMKSIAVRNKQTIRVVLAG